MLINAEQIPVGPFEGGTGHNRRLSGPDKIFHFSPQGQHIELGIAEMNLMLLLP